jgi:hypothetical protein
MYALNEAGSTVTALPPPFAVPGPTGQLEERTVEATDRGGLDTDDRHNVLYSSTSAVLQLVKSSADDYARVLEFMDVGDKQAAGAAEQPDARPGQTVDVYA